MSTHTDYELAEAIEVKYPAKYKVYILNDDYTSMEFVVDILMNVFYKTHEDAERIMLEVHQTERGLCGIYSHEVAETKVIQVSKKARKSGFPLKAIMEKES